MVLILAGIPPLESWAGRGGGARGGPGISAVHVHAWEGLHCKPGQALGKTGYCGQLVLILLVACMVCGSC